MLDVEYSISWKLRPRWCSFCRFLDRFPGLQLHRGVYVPMTWKMLGGRLGTTHSLRCLEISVLVITSSKRQSNGRGSFQPWSMYPSFAIALSLKESHLWFHDPGLISRWCFFLSRLQLPAERLWISIFKDDEEAFQIWHKEVSLILLSSILYSTYQDLSPFFGLLAYIRCMPWARLNLWSMFYNAVNLIFKF